MTHAPVIPDNMRIGRTALLVADLDKMVKFYCDIVGLKVQTQNNTTATLGTDKTPLLVLEQEDASSRSRDQAGLFHNAFKVPTRTALGAALERIRKHGKLDGASDHKVSEALYLTDPEDNGIEIYTDRPKDGWPHTDDGQIQMGTAPLSIPSIAAASDGAAKVPDGTTVGHVHLETSSIEAAREFYVEKLGLNVRTELQSALFLAAGDYHHHLGVNSWHNRSEPAGGLGLNWFEFVMPDEDAFAKVRSRLEETDIPVREHASSIEITDPDGTTVRIKVK